MGSSELSESERSKSLSTLSENPLNKNLSNSSTKPEANESNGRMSKNTVETKNGNDISKETVDYLKNLYNPERFPENFDKWSLKEQHDWMIKDFEPRAKSYPKSLLNFLPGMARPADCGRSPTERPDWLDMEKFRRGQKFILDNFFGTTLALVTSILSIYTFQDGVKPMIITKKSDTPYSAFKRFLETIESLLVWYESDPWTKGTKAYRKIAYVRKQHQIVRNLLDSKANKEIDEACEIPNAWCPMRNILLEDFKAGCPERAITERPYAVFSDTLWRPKGINQSDMAIMQFGFVGHVLLFPQYFGIHNPSEEDLDAFCHFWRGTSYLIGQEDEYNFCTGTLEEIKERSRDITEHWVKQNFREVSAEWEHLTRCLYEGVTYYFPGFPFESLLFHTTSMLNIPMSRLYASMSYYARFMSKVLKWYAFYLSKLPGVTSLTNKLLRYTLKRARNFSPEKHAELEKRSKKVLEATIST